MSKVLAILLPIVVLAACSHGNCGADKRKSQAAQQTANQSANQAANSANQATTQAGAPVAKSSSSERVKVYKPDGSLQCGQGQKIALTEMQKDLKGVQVYSSENKNDGMMRIQVCGSPTGNCNVYEIDRKNLDAAVKYGFKEWLNE